MHLFLLASGVRDLFAADAELHATDQVISEVTFFVTTMPVTCQAASKPANGLGPAPVVLDSEGHPTNGPEEGLHEIQNFWQHIWHRNTGTDR